MKKFFAVSAAFHLAIFAFLLSSFYKEEKIPAPESYVTISLSKAPEILTSHTLETVKKKQIKKKKVLDLADKIDSKNPEDETSEKTKASSNSSLAQKEKLTYSEELYHFLKNKNHYPPIAAKLRHSGEVKVKIEINKSGQFQKVYLVTPSKFRTLNKGTITFLNKVAQFKPLPNNLNNETFEVPIVYEL